MSSDPTQDQEGPYAGQHPTFYDKEMAVMIKQVMGYLSGPRGQWATNRLAQRDPELHRAITVTHGNKIPWHNLGLPRWTP